MTLQDVKKELAYLVICERMYNPRWRFVTLNYSKRRARLVRMYWALLHRAP